MKSTPGRLITLVCAVAAMLTPGAAAQQSNPSFSNSLQNALATEDKLSPMQRDLLSGGARNWFAMAHQLLEPEQEMGDAGVKPVAKTAKAGKTVAPKLPLVGMVPVSSGLQDYLYTRAGGFSQNNASSAWCGNSMVSGYVDTAALLYNFSNYIGGASLNGAAVSADGGQTFTDLVYMNPGPLPINGLFGDPVVVCADASRFYYVSSFQTGEPVGDDGTGFSLLSAIGVNLSNDGGQTWTTPTAPVAKGFGYLLDHAWIAIDPENKKHLVLTYSDLDFSGFTGAPNAACPSDTRDAIEMVSSTDAGNTWSAPQVLVAYCEGSGHAVGAPRVAFGPSGHVYVAYVKESTDGTVEIDTISSGDGGATFGAPATVSPVSVPGVYGYAQGYFRTNPFPSIAVDTSNGPGRGTVYVAWVDGRNHSTLDIVAPDAKYHFSDVLLSKSGNGGGSWSYPTVVSPGSARDQFQQSVAVSGSGAVAVCYDDRRNDPRNNAVDRYCSISQDQGSTFSDTRMTAASWTPAHLADNMLGGTWIGDFDGVTADATGAQTGFFASFQVQTNTNPNVFGVKF